MSWEPFLKMTELLMGGGGFAAVLVFFKFLFDRKDKKLTRPATARMEEQAVVEKLIMNTSMANTAMAVDNDRLRKNLQDAEHDKAELADWWQHRWEEREAKFDQKQAELQDEIESMRERMVELIAELDMMRSKLAAHIPQSP